MYFLYKIIILYLFVVFYHICIQHTLGKAWSGPSQYEHDVQCGCRYNSASPNRGLSHAPAQTSEDSTGVMPLCANMVSYPTARVIMWSTLIVVWRRATVGWSHLEKPVSPVLPLASPGTSVGLNKAHHQEPCSPPPPSPPLSPPSHLPPPPPPPLPPPPLPPPLTEGHTLQMGGLISTCNLLQKGADHVTVRCSHRLLWTMSHILCHWIKLI